MPRFVILRHDAPTGLHFDFMLERGGVLATWSMKKPPSVGVEQIAERLPDHRVAYLDYEGPISGGRGTVSRWEQGTYDEVGWDEDRVLVELRGEKLACRVLLEQIAGRTATWRMRNARPDAV